MSILDWGLCDADISAARKVLQEDEQLVLVIKPRAELDWHSDWFRWIVVVLASVILVGMALEKARVYPLAPLLTLPFWGILLWVASEPWRKYRCARRTLYLLTNRRAIVLQGRLFGHRSHLFTLQRGMIDAVAVRGDGSGNIVFVTLNTWRLRNEHIVDDIRQIGFMDIDNVKTVQQILENQIGLRCGV